MYWSSVDQWKRLNLDNGDVGVYGGGDLRGAPTPRIDKLAREGLRLTQFLVEPGCTPSRAATMTSRYSVRLGLSLVIVPGGPVPPTGKKIAADYVYHIVFDGERIKHMTKIWNDAISMQQLGWS